MLLNWRSYLLRCDYSTPFYSRHLNQVLSGCATVGSEVNGSAACPPVVEHSREIQAWATEELAVLPKGSAILEMPSDYAVTRVQAQACIF